MAGDVVNLRAFRKQKARSDRATDAEAKRRQFGRTKAEKAKDAAERERRERTIDGHRREPE